MNPPRQPGLFDIEERTAQLTDMESLDGLEASDWAVILLVVAVRRQCHDDHGLAPNSGLRNTAKIAALT